MRKDMNQVLLDGGRHGHQSTFGGRQFKLIDIDEPLEIGRIGMRPAGSNYASRDRHANIRFAPLKRFLASRVGRPWDRVFAEANTRFLPDWVFSTRDWLSQNVAKNGYFNTDNEIVFGTEWNGIQNSEFYDFYVHPKTGLLCSSKGNAFSRVDKKAREAEKDSVRLKTCKVISETLQLHKRDGVWYSVTLRNANDFVGLVSYQSPFDSFLKRSFFQCRKSANDLYGKNDVCARSHRALGVKAMKKFGLE